MNAEAPRYSAVVGCGPSGCLIINLLKQSSAKARLVAVDQDQEALDESGADQKIKAKQGEKVAEDIGTFEIVFIVLDPSEPGSTGWAGEIASRAAADGAYTFGLLIRPPGEAVQHFPELHRLFGGATVIDANWIFEKRGSKDPAMALQIALNFTAHALTFLAGAIDSGDLSVPALRKATEGRTTAFAASHISDPIAIYSLTMSKINRGEIKSGIVFLDDAIEDIPARRIFLAIGRSLPNAELSMIRIKGLEPFKILAMLAY
jgi:threonine dehydrogenase-like Zn-dependent dehydrogenase